MFRTQPDAASDPGRPISEAIARASADGQAPVTLWSLSQPPKRPALLPVLYGLYAALQVMDVVSTKKALASGAREANTLSPGNMGATVALKAASVVATYSVVQKTRKKAPRRRDRAEGDHERRERRRRRTQ